MRRLIILTLALLLLAPPGEAFAHAFGRTYNLPVPFWLYLFGASAAHRARNTPGLLIMLYVVPAKCVFMRVGLPGLEPGTSSLSEKIGL